MSTTAQIVGTADLAELIRPFVRARFNRQPDPDSKFGGLLPRAAVIDIQQTALRSVDADIRNVTDEGVEVFFYDRCNLIPWLAIRSITIAGLDRDANRLNEVVVEHDHRRKAAA